MFLINLQLWPRNRKIPGGGSFNMRGGGFNNRGKRLLRCLSKEYKLSYLDKEALLSTGIPVMIGNLN